jgi:hypothetical protein
MDRDIALETRRSAEQHSLPRMPPLSARSPSVVAARHAGEGISGPAVAAIRGLRGKLGRPPFIIIVAEVT